MLHSINQDVSKKVKKTLPALYVLILSRLRLLHLLIKTQGLMAIKKSMDENDIYLLIHWFFWSLIVHAANIHDGTRSQELVEDLLAYLPRMKKILVDDAYKKTFKPWVENNVLGLEVEIASKPPSSKGFVPVKWRWVNERTFGWYNFFRRLSKDYEKTSLSAESWVLWANTKILLNRFPE